MRKIAISFNYLDSTIHGVLSMPEIQSGDRFTDVIIPGARIPLRSNSCTSILQNMCTLLASDNTATFSFNHPEILSDQHGGILAATLDVLIPLPQIPISIFLVTYSYDADMLLRNFSLYKQATRFIFISPTPSRLETSAFLNNRRAMLFLVDKNDKKSDWMEITHRLDEHKGQVSSHTIPTPIPLGLASKTMCLQPSIPLSPRTPGKVNHD